jgi:hypothetical protein
MFVRTVAVRHLDASHHDACRHARQRSRHRIGVDGGKRPPMAGVHGLQEIVY